jgi:hypothetical protein
MRVMTAGYHKIPRIDTICCHVSAGPHSTSLRTGSGRALPIFSRGIAISPTRFTESLHQRFLKFCSFIYLFFGIQGCPEEFIYPAIFRILLGTAVFALIVPSTIADMFPTSGPFVSGKRARLYSGQAAAPKKAPAAVKRAIWAANQLCSKPYRYGGGHKSFDDHGYDCSGTVSYALGAAGLISSPMSSIEFRRYGERGRGKWITIYAREVTRSLLLPGCDSIRRRTIITPANGRRAGKPFIGRRADSKQGIPSTCDFPETVVSAVLSGHRFASLEVTR